MNIVQEIEQRYRNNPKHGVWFSIGASAYKSSVGDRVSFGDNTTAMQGGALYNWQDIILDGKVVGYLQEVESGRLFDPMTSSFIVPIADCSEHELWDEMEVKYKENPHLYDSGEVLELRFATLNQMLEYLEIA
jgi:hypothetical protein